MQHGGGAALGRPGGLRRHLTDVDGKAGQIPMDVGRAVLGRWARARLLLTGEHADAVSASAQVLDAAGALELVAAAAPRRVVGRHVEDFHSGATRSASPGRRAQGRAWSAAQRSA